jgi:hypothetical protein
MTFRSYNSARIFSVAFLLALLFHPLWRIFLVLNTDKDPHSGLAVNGGSPIDPALAIATLVMIVSGIGTASTILLGWRADRRQAKEFKLKIEQLELQLQEARMKSKKGGE